MYINFFKKNIFFDLFKKIPTKYSFLYLFEHNSLYLFSLFFRGVGRFLLCPAERSESTAC